MNAEKKLLKLHKQSYKAGMRREYGNEWEKSCRKNHVYNTAREQVKW